MKTYWLVAVISLQIIFPHSWGAGSVDELSNDPAELISYFVKVVVGQLKNDPAFAERLKDILADLRETFSGKAYQGSFIPPLMNMLDTFFNNGYFISPETVAKLMKSVINQATRQPDKLTNNLRRVGHRGVKLVGDTIKNVGSLGSSVIRVVEDAHNKQRQYMDPIFAEIPYIGTILRKINSAIAKVIGTVHMIVKLGVKGVGTIISDFAEKRRLNLKQKTEEERRAAKEAEEIDDENDEGNDSDEEAEGDGDKPKDGKTPAKEDPKDPKAKKKGAEKEPPKKGAEKEPKKDGNGEKDKQAKKDDKPKK